MILEIGLLDNLRKAGFETKYDGGTVIDVQGVHISI